MTDEPLYAFQPGLTTHQLAKALLEQPDLPVVYEHDGFEQVILKVEVDTAWDGVTDDGKVPVVRLHSDSGHFGDDRGGWPRVG